VGRERLPIYGLSICSRVGVKKKWCGGPRRQVCVREGYQAVVGSALEEEKRAETDVNVWST